MNSTTISHTRLGRRSFLGVLAGGMTLSLPGWALGRCGLWLPGDDLPLTPRQNDGPFYPETAIDKQLINDTDLHQRLAGHEFAKGQVIVVDGVIKDQRGMPLAGSIVEIWQACATGRYHHSQDEKNTSLLDNNFQFWGRAITEADGKYSFKTIIPGTYPGRTARHIHYRVDSNGHQRFSTQCFFSDFGDDNARDDIYGKLNPQERNQLTVQVDKPTAAAEPWTGVFDIVLGK